MKSPATSGCKHHRRPGAAAFTFMEVMVALALLATATTVIMAQWSGLHDARRRVMGQQKAQAALSGIVERLVSLDGGTIGTAGAPWSQRRFFDRTGTTRIGRAPLTETAADPIDNLVTQGLLLGSTGLPGLKVYIEYYRALTDGAAQGLLSTADLTSDAYQTRFKTRSVRDGARLNVDNLFSALPADAPLVIRVMATWRLSDAPPVDTDADGVFDDEEDADADGRPLCGHLELFLARRQ